MAELEGTVYAIVIMDHPSVAGDSPQDQVLVVTETGEGAMTQRRRVPVGRFFAVAFAWTWTLWWTAALTQLDGFLLVFTGGLGPLVGAAWVVGGSDRAYRCDFLRRIWNPRDIPASSWVALVAIALAPALLGAGVAGVFGAVATVPAYTVASVLAVALFALAAGSVEEPGWRGAALDMWQQRARPLVAAVGIGAFWAMWHLPLYFIEGSYQHGLGFGSLRFWLTNLVLIELSVLYVWLTNSAGGSILIVILAHAGFNVAGELVPRSTMGDVIAFLAVTVATLAVVLATKGGLSSGGERSRKLPESVERHGRSR